MITEKKLINLISKILKIKSEKINLSSGMNNIEKGDCLAHLSILSELDNLSSGKAAKINGLSNSMTVAEIFKLLKKAKLAK